MIAWVRVGPTAATVPAWRAFAFVLALLAAAGPARADYVLAVGDVLDVSVLGFPDLKQRAPIGMDGEVVIPLVGPVQVRGLTVADARAVITKALAGKIQVQPTVDGRELQRLISGNQIVVQVAEYRPIYVSGAVALPGERPFRPGMTVRQAIALAGGIQRLPRVMDAAGVQGTVTLAQAADFRAEYEALSAQLAGEQAHIWRLRRQLGENVEFSTKDAAVSPRFSGAMQTVESEQLKAVLENRDADGSILHKAIEQAEAQINTLNAKKQKDQQASEADQNDYESVKALFDKGMTATVRLSDARRAALLSADQLLQSIVETANVERQRAEYLRQLSATQHQGRIDSLKELEAATLNAEQIAARLKSAEEKLNSIGLQAPAPESAPERPRISVARAVDGNASQQIQADDDTALAPGDVLTVSLDPSVLTSVGVSAHATP